MELEIIKWLVFGIMGVAVWFLKRNIEETKEDLKNLRNEQIHIRQNYVHKDDFKDFKIEFKSWFDELKMEIRLLRNEKDHVAR